MGQIYSPIGCPTLDKLCGGGVPHEALIYLYGGPGLGKTTIALNMMRAMGSGVWVDTSHTLVHSYAEVEGGGGITVVQPPPDADIGTLLPLIGTTPIIVVDDLTTISGNLARPLQVFMAQAKRLLPGSNTTILLTNQVRQCKNGYLPPGGLSYTKYSDLVLEVGPHHKRLGDCLNVDISIVKSVVGPCQGVRTIPFRCGLDRVQDTITSAVKVGVIKQAGSWYSYGEYRAQGLDNFRWLLDQATIDEIYQQVMK